MSKLSGIALFALVLLIGTTSWVGDGTTKIARDVPYQGNTEVDTKIINECTELGTKLAHSRRAGEPERHRLHHRDGHGHREESWRRARGSAHRARSEMSGACHV
ncbi:MAG: hypothetical protein ACYSWU_22460 [Planctomycetota bacterium]